MEAPLESDRARTPVSILLVDDREENRVALRAILSSPDHRIVEASSGAEALRRLLDEEFAVLLLDVVMPGMSGFELASAIKQRARTAGTPILFLTGQAADVELVYKGYRIGAVDYLVKPLVPEMVRAKVAVFAEMYRQRKRLEHQAALLVEGERKESELRLVELRLATERRYHHLAESVPHMILTAQPDGSIDYINQRWFEYTGISAEQAVASWDRAIHPDDVRSCQRRWRDALRSGQTFEAECRLRRAADGAFRWHLFRAVPELGPAGHVISWIGTFTDIEDQKRAHAALTEFKGTLDAVLDAVLIFEPDAGFRFVYVNEGARMLWGYRREALAQMRPFELMTDYDEDRFGALVAPLLDRSRSTITLETRCRREDGREIPVEFSFQLVHVEGGHIVSIARDITERKLAELEREHLYEEALAAVRARDEFLSVASHELRTPLSSLKLQLELLARPRGGVAGASPPPEQLQEKLQTAVHQVDRLSKLIGKLMDVSRITAGRLRLELEQLDLTAVCRDVVGRFKEDAARAGCEVKLSVQKAVGRWDRLRLEQVLTNLLANALKYGAGKPVEITVGEQGSAARLTVRDNGIGIAPEDRDRIFHRFERAASARPFGGMGLGLYIAQHIVDAHGGTIEVESQPGAGSTFTVELPREPPQRDAREPARADPASPADHEEESERAGATSARP